MLIHIINSLQNNCRLESGGEAKVEALGRGVIFSTMSIVDTLEKCRRQLSVTRAFENGVDQEKETAYER